MIRGAIILAVGFGLGYAKAMSEQEAVVNAADAVARAAKELFEDLKKQEEESKTDVGTADSADEADEVIDPDDDTHEQGETS